MTSHQAYRRTWRGALGLWCACVGAALVSGCGSGGRVATENERLRTQAAELQDQVQALQRRNEELQAELRQPAAPATMPEEIRATVPHVTEIQIERLTFARDTDNDGRPDELMIFLHPVDGRGRFVQVVGGFTVSAFLLPADGQPLGIGQITLSATQVRDAYRYSFTGIHYTFQMPVQLPQRGAAGSTEDKALVRVSHTDGLTGRTLTAERMVSLK